MLIFAEAIVFLAIVFVLNFVWNTYLEKVKRSLRSLLYISLVQTVIAGGVAYLAGEFI